jgi:hypothetical protein
VNSAKVNEIQRSSAENEHSFKIVCIKSGSNVINKTAFIGKLELRNASKLSVDGCRVSEKVGLIFYTAKLADFLLLGF